MLNQNPSGAPTKSYTELSGEHDFLSRHIGPNQADQAHMLSVIGEPDLATFLGKVVPEAIRRKADLALAPPMSEPDVLALMRDLAGQNRVFTSLIGQGYYGTHMPSVIQRNVLENPGWYTAYTPYQPEISQGRLEALLNFQTLISDLTGLAIANASLLDEASAAAEAMMLCRRQARSKAEAFFVDQNCFAQTIDVVKTRAAPLGIDIVVGDPDRDLVADEVFGALLQVTGADGAVRDYQSIIARLHEAKALAVVAADLLALVLVKSPGMMGADVAVGSAQRFGVPMGFGGPHAGFMATTQALKRAIPGRLVGVSHDNAGRPAYRLALQTREQHIRREKATSNICTAQVLLAIIAGFYGTYHGPEGLTRIARRVHHLTCVLARGLRLAGLRLGAEVFFDTLVVETGARTQDVLAGAHKARINLRPVDAGRVGLSLDETSTPALVETLWSVFGIDQVNLSFDFVASQTPDALSGSLLRDDAILAHPVFHRHRSETAMMRYLRVLMDRDLALDRSMIPLGSCTMKLNATSEMMPITWPGFSDLHPFAPPEQWLGYRAMFDDLEAMLCAVTGYDAVSLQPNSGAQGEYAGLLAIRAYHRANKEPQRDVCLIPSSAHGTNPASAVMAGMRVVVVKCDNDGNIDMADLNARVDEHRTQLAALMITYPSTHGVFEETVQEVCAIIHAAGGQVYMDGANLNALIGLAHPGEIGADVSHLNLHKTFCIPHGGGGPGVGPIGVRAHLAPYLPGHARNISRAHADNPPVSAAPYGSAGILAISYAYMKLMGAQGLRGATEVAILAANYVARRLSAHYPVLYKGRHGFVAHECILDLRAMTKNTGITVEDVAKRLMDYGFHAPTMAWPVAGTLMIEPTESESLEELDRFCGAMIAIAEEIDAIAKGTVEREASALKNAPHPAQDLCADVWERPYSRRQAAYPKGVDAGTKYWPPVGRVDSVAGDRNLVCTCPPLEAYDNSQ